MTFTFMQLLGKLLV